MFREAALAASLSLGTCPGLPAALRAASRSVRLDVKDAEKSGNVDDTTARKERSTQRPLAFQHHVERRARVPLLAFRRQTACKVRHAGNVGTRIFTAEGRKVGERVTRPPSCAGSLGGAPAAGAQRVGLGEQRKQLDAERRRREPASSAIDSGAYRFASDGLTLARRQLSKSCRDIPFTVFDGAEERRVVTVGAGASANTGAQPRLPVAIRKHKHAPSKRPPPPRRRARPQRSCRTLAKKTGAAAT